MYLLKFHIKCVQNNNKNQTTHTINEQLFNLFVLSFCFVWLSDAKNERIFGQTFKTVPKCSSQSLFLFHETIRLIIGTLCHNKCLNTNMMQMIT